MNLSCFKLLPAILAVLVMTSCNGKAVHDETDIQARNNDISGKSILSGNPPHELTGEVARNLLILGALPATDGASVDKSGETVRAIVKACLEKAGQYKTFSVLDLYISKHVEDPAPIQSAHVDMSFRADVVRPDGFHVSQAAWDEDRKLYEMDEWVSTGNEIFVNAGLWFKSADEAVNNRLSKLNQNFLPEILMSLVVDKEPHRASGIWFMGKQYLLIEYEQIEYGDLQSIMRLWIEEDEGLLKKASMSMSVDNHILEKVTTFSAFGEPLTISPPKGLNMNSKGIITDKNRYVVEHY